MLFKCTALAWIGLAILAGGCSTATPPAPAAGAQPDCAAPAPGASRPATRPAEHERAGHESVKPGINRSFVAEDMVVQDFVDRFESESREVSRLRDALVAALNLSDGDDVADIGAGTGLFIGPLARAVGPHGRVYAVDIAPKFIDHLKRRIREDGLETVEVVLNTETSVSLPAASVDLAWVCDTYHHFEFPGPTLASLYDAIRPGGALVIVDFERIPGTSRDWILDHVRAGKKTVTDEITAAGFELDTEVHGVGLEENYMLRFRRP